MSNNCNRKRSALSSSRITKIRKPRKPISEDEESNESSISDQAPEPQRTPSPLIDEPMVKLPELPSTSTRRSSSTPKPSRLFKRHFADYIPSNFSRVNVTRRCKLCYSKGLKKESRFWCPNCSVALCMPHCFKEYHTK